jgi:hypothetical protein
LAAHGLQVRFTAQGLQARFTAQGFPRSILARRGITHSVATPAASQGVPALQGLPARFTAQGLPAFFAAQGLQAFLAAQGLQALFAAQGLPAFLAAQGLALHAAASRRFCPGRQASAATLPMVIRPTPITMANAVVEVTRRFVSCIPIYPVTRRSDPWFRSVRLIQ